MSPVNILPVGQKNTRKAVRYQSCWHLICAAFHVADASPGGRDADDSRLMDGEARRGGAGLWTKEGQAAKSSHLATVEHCQPPGVGPGEAFVTQVISVRNCTQTSGYVTK